MRSVVLATVVLIIIALLISLVIGVDAALYMLIGGIVVLFTMFLCIFVECVKLRRC